MAPCCHPIDIATDRIDFAVVGDHPEWVSKIPRREGVGGEALVNQSKG